MSDKNLATCYDLRSGQGEDFDMMAKLHGDLFATQRQYIAACVACP